MYYVYILQNDNSEYYIGYSDNFERRLIEHQKRDDSTYQTIYYEASLKEKDARIRERKLKYYGSAWRALRKRITA